MSAKSSRNKSAPGSRRKPAQGRTAQGGGTPAGVAGSGAAPTPDAGSVQGNAAAGEPLRAFRPPTVNTPSGRHPRPRIAAPMRTAPVGPVSVKPGAVKPASVTPGAVKPGAGSAASERPASADSEAGAGAPRPEPDLGTAVAPGPRVTGTPTVGREPAWTSTATDVHTPPTRPPFLAGDMPRGPVEVMSFNCSQIDDVEPHALGMTYWFNAAPDGDPYPVTIQFTGRRVAGDEDASGTDTFETVRTLDRVVPGSGRVALTARVPGVARGTWEVTATPVLLRRRDGTASPVPRGHVTQGSSKGTTAFMPVVNVRAPGVRIGAWPTLVALGWLVALVVQWLLAGQRDLPVERLLLVTVLASLVGLAGAKAYYMLSHRRTATSVLRAGMSVQGFVIAAISTLLLGGWWAAIPIGPLLDVSAPALLVGMTIGRLGCFFGGCCAGLPTASRWGIWSSDRQVGVRRTPVQLFESAMAGSVAVVTLLAVALLDPAVDGLLFVIGLAAYTLGRQVLFPFRGIPRATRYGRAAMMVLTSLVIAGSVLVLFLA